MLWLCITLPQLPLEALVPGDDDHALIVTATEGSTRSVVCANSAALRARIKPGLNYTVALAIHPRLIALPRRPEAERCALARLGAWAYQFSSQVICDEIAPDLHHARNAALWLEVGASSALFGGLPPLIERLEHELGELHYTYRLGIAPTLEGAALLARSEVPVAVTSIDALRAHVRGSSIALLGLTPEVTSQLRMAGIHTIGLLLDLPRDGVTKRFGAQLTQLLDRLTGAAADPRPLFRLPEQYQARFELEHEVGDGEALLFPLQRMLREFVGYLRARDTGVPHFSLVFGHQRTPATTLRIGLSAPDRNADLFLTLVREQLAHTRLAAPVLEIRLSAQSFAAPVALQPDLFSGALEQQEALAHTLDRIAARLGRNAIRYLNTVADHRPERSSAVASESHAPEVDFPARPLWLLPKPKPLPPRPEKKGGVSERIESGWWDGADIRRDYYVVRTRAGAALWVFRDHADQRWYLHGFWS
jgi:protein ImuB